MKTEREKEREHNPRFNEGDIVYWCHHEGNADYAVHWGRVDEQFSDAVYVDYLVPRERRLVDGIPIEDFETEQRYRKLPKGWTYDTQLFEIKYRNLPKEVMEFKLDITDPASVKEAYSKGILVKDSTIFHGKIETEITKEGFKLVKSYPYGKHHFSYRTVLPYKLYATYQKAREEVDKNIAEFYRQAALSEYDWSVEQIDKTLGRWKYSHDYSDKDVQAYRNYLLSKKNVEDIETRIFEGEFQWKYWKDKRWRFIPDTDIILQAVNKESGGNEIGE